MLALSGYRLPVSGYRLSKNRLIVVDS